MPRVPSVRYFNNRKGGGFFTQIDKVQHELALGPDDRPDGPVYRSAQRAFDKMMDMRRIAPAGRGLLVSSLIERYVTVAGTELEPTTLLVRTRQLKPFVDQYGERYASTIIPREVSAFVAERRTRKATTGRIRRWSAATGHSFIAALSAVYSWGVRESLILDNPCKKVRWPGKRSRGREAIVSEEDNALILANASPAFHELAIAIAHTGARPGELVKATAENWQDADGCLIYHGSFTIREGETKHKTTRRNKTRRIFFTGEELKRMRHRVSRYPTGPLFRNNAGRKWNLTRLSVYVNELKKRLHLPHFTCYSWRHTFATEWIKAGKSIEVLAELLGSSVETIRKHYAHLDADTGGLRRQLESFRSL